MVQIEFITNMLVFGAWLGDYYEFIRITISNTLSRVRTCRRDVKEKYLVTRDGKNVNVFFLHKHVVCSIQSSYYDHYFFENTFMLYNIKKKYFYVPIIHGYG